MTDLDTSTTEQATIDTDRRVPKVTPPKAPTAADIWRGYVEAKWLRPATVVKGRGYNAYVAPAPNPNEHLANALSYVGYDKAARTWRIGCREWFAVWARRQLHWLGRELADYVWQTHGIKREYKVEFVVTEPPAPSEFVDTER